MLNHPFDISALECFLQQHEECFSMPSASPCLTVIPHKVKGASVVTVL